MNRSITYVELALHKEKDHWLLIDGIVYDVSEYITKHPGGTAVLQMRAGRDATRDFQQIGHSTFAMKVMKEFAIGELDKKSLGFDWQQTGVTGFSMEQFKQLILAFIIVLTVSLFCRSI